MEMGKEVFEPEFLTAQEVADTLKVSVRTIYNWRKAGILSEVRTGERGILRFSREAIRRAFQEKKDAVMEVINQEEEYKPEKLIEEIEEMETHLAHLRSDLENTTKLHSSVLDGSQKNGIEAIYPPRRSENKGNDAIKQLLEEAKGEILLLGVSLRQFFHDRDFYQTIWSKLENEADIHIKALLLDPFSEAAKARVTAEEDIEHRDDPEADTHNGRVFENLERLKRTILFTDIERSIRTLQQLKKKTGKKGVNSIDAKFYGCTPFAFCFMTEDCMVIEQYHLGAEKAIAPGCIGGLIPLLRVNSTASWYQLMRKTIFHLWNHANTFISVQSLDALGKNI